MNKNQLDDLENHIRELIHVRESLGEYDANSQIILRILQLILGMALHLKEMPNETSDHD